MVQILFSITQPESPLDCDSKGYVQFFFLVDCKKVLISAVASTILVLLGGQKILASLAH